MTAHFAAASDFLTLQRRLVELFQENQGAIVTVKAAYDSRNPNELPQVIIGSGFFISREGHVLTNASIALNPDRVWIVHQGIDYAASLIGHDATTNVALLKASTTPGSNFSFLPLGDSPTLPEPGTLVLRIGAPMELSPSPSLGMVAGSESRYGQHIFPCALIRTTVSAGPGDGGAAYLDLNGRLVGIQVAALSEINSTYVLPARAIRRVRDDLVFGGEVVEGWIGFEVLEEPSVATGKRIILREVIEGTPAATAGMQVGDQLLQIGSYPIKTLDDLRNAMFYTRVGEYVTVRLRRGQDEMEVNVRLAERPASETQPVGLIRQGTPQPGPTKPDASAPQPAAGDTPPARQPER